MEASAGGQATLRRAGPEGILVEGVKAGVASCVLAHHCQEARVDSVESGYTVVDGARAFFDFGEKVVCTSSSGIRGSRGGSFAASTRRTARSRSVPSGRLYPRSAHDREVLPGVPPHSLRWHRAGDTGSRSLPDGPAESFFQLPQRHLRERRQLNVRGAQVRFRRDGVCHGDAEYSGGPG